MYAIDGKWKTHAEWMDFMRNMEVEGNREYERAPHQKPEDEPLPSLLQKQAE